MNPWLKTPTTDPSRPPESAGLPDHPRLRRAAIRCLAHLRAVFVDLLKGELSLRATSLVYTTLLSVVPLLALGFAVLKALGVHNSLEPLLATLLHPLGPQANGISERVVAFVEKIQIGVLGSVGVVLLFYTAFALIQKVESSFNYIWKIDRPQSLTHRIGEYIGVLLVGPTLVFAALALTAGILKSSTVTDIATIKPLGWVIYALSRVTPYLIIVGLFSFLYAFLVNAKVRWTAALVGGLCAGVLWQTVSLLFALFVANASNYNAVYSSFAIVIFLLIWIYLGWLVLLIGCQIAFYVQHPRHLLPTRATVRISGREADFLALKIMTMTVSRFIQGGPEMTQEEVLSTVSASADDLKQVIRALVDCGFLTASGSSPTALTPRRDPSLIGVAELLGAFRSHGESIAISGAVDQAILSTLDSADECFRAQTQNLNLRDWLIRLSDDPASGPATTEQSVMHTAKD